MSHVSRLRVTFRLDLDADNAIGPGKIALLEKMRESGSLSQAARELDMSYRRAWQLLSSLNQTFREPVVLTNVGGSGGGGTILTAKGEALVSAYRDFENDMNTRAQKHFGSLMQSASSTAAGARRSIARKPAAARRVSRQRK